MNGTCNTQEDDENCLQNFSRKPEGRDHLGDLEIDGDMWMDIKKRYEDVD
jgi:hypothetical protein